MPGTPKKKARRETAQRLGELTTPEPTTIGEEDVKAALTAKPKKRRGASPERMRELVEIRRAKAAAGDTRALGGRPRTRRTRTEAEEDALQKLVPKALKVLEEQLDDPDESVRQRAAVKVLEWGKGKPAQTVQVNGDQTHTIRYETVVMLPGVVQGLADAERTFDEIVDAEIDDPGLLPPAA